MKLERRTVRAGARATTALAVAVASAAVAVASAPAARAAEDVPVLGSVVVQARLSGGTSVPVTTLVHGVRRVPGGTVLYYSMGQPADTKPAEIFNVVDDSLSDRWYDSAGPRLAEHRIVDLEGKLVYQSLVDAEENALASPNAATPLQPGKFLLYYEVLPELPATATRVDVMLGKNDVVPDVPVEDGVLEPAQEQTGPLPLGGAWPRIDLEAVRAADGTNSIRPLQTVVSDIEETVVTREKPKEVSVDLAADVLFALDSATLTPAAQAKVRQVAADVNERAAAGTVKVVGHTDNSGSGPYNDDLSRRRAAAVEAVLRPAVTAQGVRFAVEGKGEREPVADNGSEDGRKQNRRVSVVYTPKAGG